jgi:hypothetical protein
VSLIAAFTALLTAAARWLELQILTHPEKIQDEIDSIEDQIEVLRDRGDPVSSRRADRLRNRLARKRGFAASLPAPRPPAPGGSTGANDGRDLHAPGC